MRIETFIRRAARIAAVGVALAALAGCNDLLDVQLPTELTDEVLTDPVGAGLQMTSVIGNFENAFNVSFWDFHGREDGGEIFARSPGTNRGSLAYGQAPSTSTTSAVAGTAAPDWFTGYMTAYLFATQLHEKLDKQWTQAQVTQRKQYLAETSIYTGAILGILGSSMCEIAINNGKLTKWDEVLTMADAQLTKALSEIDANGADFALPFGVSNSARNLTYGLRAQVRWMKGDMAGAKADAERVPRNFVAYVTRDEVPTRRNFAFEAGGGGGGSFAEVNNINDWWKGQPNPVNGKAWPAVIPFTGYVSLGILPDGRAVRDDGLAIRTAGNYRTAVENTAVADPRVRTALQIIQGKGGVQRPTNIRYKAYGDDVPLVNWKEMWLIRAEAVGGQGAIDLVNDLRTADNLPRVTYANPNNATQIKYLIIEERRRALFLEGRFFFTKLKNLDLLWFPRADGQTPEGSLNLGGGIRFIMPENEYILNPNVSLAVRATGCSKNEAPILDR